MTYILGISAFYHDSAAALICNGKIIGAVQEERFSRIKNDKVFPKESILWLLNENELTLKDVEAVVFYEKPFLKFERILETCIHFSPKGLGLFKHAIPVWLKEKLFQKIDLKKSLKEMPGGEEWNQNLLFSEHHLSHAAAAFYPSPYESSAILTIDGIGEWASTTISLGDKENITRLAELSFPHSYGMFYSTITAFLGFKVNSGEYKVMGLAPYGEPKYVELIKNNIINIKEDGSFRLNMRYFSFATKLRMFSSEMEKIFGVKAREPEAALEQIHMDIAASLQDVTDEWFFSIAKHAKKLSGQSNLCLGGGVALNCASTGKLAQSGLFENIWIQPSAGDAGSALGAALSIWYLCFGKKRKLLDSYTPYLGPSFDDTLIRKQFDALDACYEYIDDDNLSLIIADYLAKGNVVAWMQDKAEFSPRALGNRSIIADPRVANLQKDLNLKIKFRESFRPFAPVILEEEAINWFDGCSHSPYMNFIYSAVSGVKNKIPSVVHVDGTARVQTVSYNDNPRFYNLLKKFYNMTGCPVLVNTSFNVRGEPMVLSPRDAFNCFMNTNIDILVVGNFILLKNDQFSNKYEKHSYDLD